MDTKMKQTHNTDKMTNTQMTEDMGSMHSMDNHGSMVEGSSNLKEYIKFIIILSSIGLVSLVIQNNFAGNSLNEYLRIFMGVFLVTFASFKFIGYKMFTMMFAGYDVVAKKIKAYSYAFPFIELGLGVLYLANLIPTIRDVATLLVTAVASIGVINEIRKRSGIHCACLGNIIKLPLSTVSIVEDLGMALMAIYMLTS